MEMSRASVGRWLAVGLWASAAWAQPAPEPVVVTVLGTNYVARELGIENGADEQGGGAKAQSPWRALTWEEVRPEIHALRKPAAGRAGGNDSGRDQAAGNASRAD